MKDSGEPPSLIHLSDRRPTPLELPAFASEPPAAPEPALPPDVFQVALEPLRSLEIGQALLLEQLLPLALPSLRHFQLAPLIERLRTRGDLSEEALRVLETRLGTYPRRVRQRPWLREPGYPLAVYSGADGMDEGRAGDTGMTSWRHLFLLPDGKLGYVETMQGWHKREPGVSAAAQTPTGARRVTAHDAVRLFPLHQILGGLRAILWFDRAHPQLPLDPELESRRQRFLERVKDLSRIADEYNKRLWRLSFPPD